MPSDRSRVSSESPARLEVRLLGAVEVILDGRRLGAFNSLRLQRFLALIALRRDLQHRSRLAFELWPDSDERQARTNLRKLLHDFRHSLPDIGEFVQIDNEIVRWIPTGPSEVDVLRFREAMAAGDLELAARRYSGDLLPACYDDWVMDERAKLRAEAYGVLVRLRDEAAGRDDHEATIRHAQAIIDLEPTDEVAVRIQMEAHLALGDRAAALRCYHRYAEVLQRELAVQPGEAIGAMYRQLRADTRTRQDGARTWRRSPTCRSWAVTAFWTGSTRHGTRRGRGGHISCWCPAKRESGSPVSPWSWDGAFEPRGTWWLRLVRTRRQADCRGAQSSTCCDRMLSGATSTRWARSGGPSSLVSSPSSSRLPSHPHRAARATWLSAIGCSMQWVGPSSATARVC